MPCPPPSSVLLIPQLKGWKEVLVCVTAGVLAVAGMIYLPGKWYIIIAALTATLIGGGRRAMRPEIILLIAGMAS